MTVQVQRRGAVATIVLDRPKAMNALNAELRDDLLKALQEAGEDGEVRAVVITGSGRAFSSGADLRAGFETTTPEGHADLQSSLRKIHPILKTIREMPKPVVASVNGAAAGVGCSVALACDLIIAAESSYFL